jgi:hypothetical protein
MPYKKGHTMEWLFLIINNNNYNYINITRIFQ